MDSFHDRSLSLSLSLCFCVSICLFLSPSLSMIYTCYRYLSSTVLYGDERHNVFRRLHNSPWLYIYKEEHTFLYWCVPSLSITHTVLFIYLGSSFLPSLKNLLIWIQKIGCPWCLRFTCTHIFSTLWVSITWVYFHTMGFDSLGLQNTHYNGPSHRSTSVFFSCRGIGG